MSEELEKEQESEIAGVEEETAPELIERYKDSDGVARPELWRIGIDELNVVNSAPGLTWREVGPNPLNNLPLPADSQLFQGLAPVGGEVTDIAIDTSGAADATMYAATNNGGIFKSTDAGATWAPASDGVPSLSMGAVAIDAGNRLVLYAGSGNLFDGQGGFVKASGLYKSVDEGRTWFVADGGVFGTTFGGKADATGKDRGIGINRIISTAADALLVGTAKGLFRSIDGGLNFGANAPNFDDGNPVISGFVTALTMDTAAPNRAWVAIRGLDDKLEPFPGGGLFQLTLNANGSVTASANLLNNPGGLAGVRFGLVVFAQSTQFPAGTANSNIIYAGAQDIPHTGKPFFIGLFRSTDSGAHWTPLGNLKTGLTAANNEDKQSGYDFTLGVDPQNADLVYAGFTQIWRSLNGTTAATFAPCSTSAATQNMVHWDQHELVFSPASHWAGQPTTVYVGTDGGVARSTNAGTNWVQLNTGMGNHLFLGIDIGRGATRNQALFGGSQDNGTPGHRATDAGVVWSAGIDGDGGVVAVDPSNAAIVYGFDNQFLIKTSDGGDHWALSDLGSIPIINATIGPPITVTARGHLFQDGQVVTISGVQGNTAANGPQTVVIVDADNFHLVGTTGNSAYTGGGFATGVRIGRGLANPDSHIRRVALVPSGIAIANVVYVSEERDLRKSTDGGANFAAAVVKHFDAFIFALVCPDANRVWVGTGDGKVHFSNDAGTSWKDFSPGGSGPITGIAVDTTDFTRVVVVYGGFSGIDRNFQTRHCFLSTNEGGDWKDISGTDGSALPNLPDLPLHSVVLDNSTTPSTIVVGCDAAVLRSANEGASWELLGAGLPNVTCRSLAIDNTDTARTPRLLRLGTYGRSCYELAQLTGAHLVVKANFAFGPVLLSKTPFLFGKLVNVGDAALTFVSFTRSAGDADFDFDIAPDLTPLTPGGVRAFSIRFTAAGSGIRSATFTLQTNDATNPLIQIPVSGLTFTTGKPRLAVKASFQFGQVERGANRSIRFYITNTGLADLVMTEFGLKSNGEFVLTSPTPPLTLTAGEEQHYDLIYGPNTWGGDSSTALHIASNDPRQPVLDIPVNGTAPRNIVLIIGLIILGAAVVVGGVVAYEELTKKK
jgi:hypothetical protein